MTWFGWPARRKRHADLSDLLEPLPTCADEAELLDLASRGREVASKPVALET